MTADDGTVPRLYSQRGDFTFYIKKCHHRINNVCFMSFNNNVIQLKDLL